MVKTTVNLKKTEINLVKAAIIKYNLSFSEFIALVINRIVKNEYVILNISDAVKYQERKNKNDWIIHHIKFANEDYEIITGMRKIIKRSVSFIISDGIKKYLNDIVKDLSKEKECKSDNYHSSGYFISCKIVNGKYHFKIVWGLPDNLQKGDNYPGKITEVKDFLSIVKKK